MSVFVFCFFYGPHGKDCAQEVLEGKKIFMCWLGRVVSELVWALAGAIQ